MAEWVEHFNAAGVPCGPIYDLAQVFADPQVQHQEMVLELEQPAGKVKTLGFPLKLSETPAALHSPAPQLGQHTEEILQRIGYSAAEIDILKAKKVV
jgi:crotonobetainyl-CoA:carnitine CoA-transferase CaiB-like acyl-CoA transferase